MLYYVFYLGVFDKLVSFMTQKSFNSSANISSLEISTSRQFNSWLYEQNLSLAFTTYQAGKIFFIGLQPNGKLSIFERTFDRSMGLYATQKTLYLSSLYQIWRFENALETGQIHNGYDALYVPQIGYITGDLDIHDLIIEKSGELVFVNTLFSCLATVSHTHSFKPIWQPPFITKLAAEDRCHLNGVALKEGKAHFVTVVGTTDIADGWRDKRQNGGCVINIRTNQIVAENLSMPHSPRYYRDKLWLLNSGTGEFGFIKIKEGKFEPIAFCPGYLRGCAFSGKYAIVGLSQSRDNKTFADLPLNKTLEKQGVEPRCGLMVIDLETGDLVHWLRLQGVVKELYDVAVLPKIKRPMAIGFKSDEIRRVISIEV